ncbi:MAG TPA: palindromic element RPE4 domain-containing protein [Rickettsia endosymbiont of Bembidion nr. Transversale]|nr:palindromic element RPE4 domain-containing protein [Rickettsia endosymbiont of Bembidion nr. Transversale]
MDRKTSSVSSRGLGTRPSIKRDNIELLIYIIYFLDLVPKPRYDTAQILRRKSYFYICLLMHIFEKFLSFLRNLFIC